MLYCLLKAKVVISTHSAMGGAWMPLLVVTSMSESAIMGYLIDRSTPAEKRCMSLRLSRSFSKLCEQHDVLFE